MGLFSSKKSTTNQVSNQTFNDNRQVNDAGGGIVGTGNTIDASTHITGTDPGLVRLAEINAQLLGAVAESQSDAVRFMTDAGVDVIREAGGSATDLLEVSAQNSARAWEHTLDASESVIDRLIGASERNTTAATSLASAALSTFQPSEAKAGDALKWGVIAAAAIAGLLLLRK